MILWTVLLLSGCVIGKFPENRERMHNMGTDEKFCQQHPDRCYQGIPW